MEYANQTIYNTVFSSPDDWFAARPRAATVGLVNCGFCKSHEIPKKDRTPRKVWTPRQERIFTHSKEKISLHPVQPPFINWAWHLWYGIFLLASLGYLPGHAPSQLLHTCSLAECEKLGKVLDVTATTENISVISILLMLDPKHSSYWEGN